MNKFIILFTTILLTSCKESNKGVSNSVEMDSMLTKVVSNHSGNCVVIETTPRGFDLPEGVSGAWGNRNKVWRKRVLKVEFFGKVTPHQKEMTKKYMGYVDDLCGIRFQFGTYSRSDLRIGFDQYDGHWSYLGTDCSTIPERERTMNIALDRNSSDLEWKRVAVHEVLHALGFGHSQQNPQQSIPWNEKKVIDYYKRTQGWSEAETRHQVLRGYRPYGTFNNGYDKDSIMHYPVQNFLTVGDYEVGWNTTPSSRDVAMLRKLYGK